MGSIVIPTSEYPAKIDSDRTLFFVANTAESVLSQDLEAWATTIYVVPNDDREIWGENGFINIAGELIYYDGVLKDYSSGRIYGFVNCIRNVGPVKNHPELSRKPEFHAAGVKVRGFVVAEHHNALANAIANIEKYIGIDNSEDKNSIDWLLNYMKSVAIIGDDAFCPQILFYFNVVSSDPFAGTVIEYTTTITGSYDSFVIDFGDGTTESAELTGTHTYSPNHIIDPIVKVTSELCDVTQTVPEREVPSEPNRTATSTGPFFPNIPVIPDFPNFDLSVTNDVPNTFQFPPIVFPCLDIGPFGPIVIPSKIDVVQSNIIPSQITFGDPPSIPTLITISADLTIPSVITLSGISNINVSVDLNVPPLDLFLNGQYCVNCTNYMEASVGQTIEAITDQGCDACKPETKAIVSRIQVVVHDLYVSSQDPNTGQRLNARYDYIKLLVVAPDGTTALVMGGAKTEDSGPQFDITEPVTLTFDDNSSGNIYDFGKKLTTGTYKSAPNGNTATRSSGSVTLGSKAPSPGVGYGAGLSVFTDKQLSNGKWKVYLAVGPQSGGPDTIVEVEKVCIRVYYNETADENCATATPPPSGGTPTRTPRPTYPPTPSPTPKRIIPPRPDPIPVYPPPDPPPFPSACLECGGCLFVWVAPYGWCFMFQTCFGPCACLDVPSDDPSVGVAFSCCAPGIWPPFPPGGPGIINPPAGGEPWPPNYCVKTKNDANQTCVSFTAGNKDPEWTVVSGPYQDYNTCLQKCNGQDPPGPDPEPNCGTCEYSPLIYPCGEVKNCSYKWDKATQKYVFASKDGNCDKHPVYTNCTCLSAQILLEKGFIPKEQQIGPGGVPREFYFTTCYAYSWEIAQRNCTGANCQCPTYSKPPSKSSNVIASCENRCGNCEWMPKTVPCGVLASDNQCVYNFAMGSWSLDNINTLIQDRACKCRGVDVLKRLKLLGANEEKAGTYKEAPRKLSGGWEKITGCFNGACLTCDEPIKNPTDMSEFGRSTCYNKVPPSDTCGKCYHMTSVKPCNGGKIPNLWVIGSGDRNDARDYCPCKYKFDPTQKGIENIFKLIATKKNGTDGGCLCPAAECLTPSKLWLLGIFKNYEYLPSGIRPNDTICVDCGDVTAIPPAWEKAFFSNVNAAGNCIDSDSFGVFSEDPNAINISSYCNCPDIPNPLPPNGNPSSYNVKTCEKEANKCSGTCVYKRRKTDLEGRDCTTCWDLDEDLCKPPNNTFQCVPCLRFFKGLDIEGSDILYQDCALKENVPNFAPDNLGASSFVATKAELPLWETPSVGEKITRPKMCKFADKKPLAMIKQGCGSCAVRKCEIYGMCSHTHSLPQMPEVSCCQTCPSYKSQDEVAVELQNTDTFNRAQNIVTIKADEIIYIDGIGRVSGKPFNQIKEHNHIESLQTNLEEENKIIVLPKMSSLKISVAELLGQEDDKTTS